MASAVERAHRRVHREIETQRRSRCRCRSASCSGPSCSSVRSAEFDASALRWARLEQAHRDHGDEAALKRVVEQIRRPRAGGRRPRPCWRAPRRCRDRAADRRAAARAAARPARARSSATALETTLLLIAIEPAWRSLSDDPLVAARRHVEQLAGDSLARSARGSSSCARRAQVHQLALAGGDVAVDRFAHERVDEAERLLGPEDLGVDVLARSPRRLPSRSSPVNSLSRRDRTRPRRRSSPHGRPSVQSGVEPRQSQQHRPRCGARTELAQASSTLARGRLRRPRPTAP